jgi:hypothetical protein
VVARLRSHAPGCRPWGLDTGAYPQKGLPPAKGAAHAASAPIIARLGPAHTPLLLFPLLPTPPPPLLCLLLRPLQWDLQMSTGTDAEELVIAGCISGDVRTVQVRSCLCRLLGAFCPADSDTGNEANAVLPCVFCQVSAWSLVGGALRTNWVSQTNPSFQVRIRPRACPPCFCARVRDFQHLLRVIGLRTQENPTVRADGPYIAVALWGDVGGDAPTTVLLVAGVPPASPRALPSALSS